MTHTMWPLLRPRSSAPPKCRAPASPPPPQGQPRPTEGRRPAGGGIIASCDFGHISRSSWLRVAASDCQSRKGRERKGRRSALERARARPQSGGGARGRLCWQPLGPVARKARAGGRERAGNWGRGEGGGKRGGEETKTIGRAPPSWVRSPHRASEWVAMKLPQGRSKTGRAVPRRQPGLGDNKAGAFPLLPSCFRRGRPEDEARLGPSFATAPQLRSRGRKVGFSRVPAGQEPGGLEPAAAAAAASPPGKES